MAELSANALYERSTHLLGIIWLTGLCVVFSILWGFLAFQLIENMISAPWVARVLYAVAALPIVGGIIWLLQKEDRLPVYIAAFAIPATMLFLMIQRTDGFWVQSIVASLFAAILLALMIESHIVSYRIRKYIIKARYGCSCCDVTTRAFYELCRLGRRGCNVALEIACRTSNPDRLLKIIDLRRHRLSPETNRISEYLNKRIAQREKQQRN